MTFTVTATWEINPLHDGEDAKTELGKAFRQAPIDALLDFARGTERLPVAVSVERKAANE